MNIFVETPNATTQGRLKGSKSKKRKPAVEEKTMTSLTNNANSASSPTASHGVPAEPIRGIIQLQTPNLTFIPCQAQLCFSLVLLCGIWLKLR